MRLLLVGLLLSSVLLSPALVFGSSATPIPDSPKGFEQQYREFFSSYTCSDEQNLELKLDEFAIPSHWFSESFGVDNGPEVVKLYSPEFEYFKFSTLLKLRRYGGRTSCRTSPAKVHTKRDHTIKVEMKLLPSTPINQIPPAQSFIISLGAASWMDTYIYMDGAFRFYGKGGSTFWNPVKIHRADPCGPNNGKQPNGWLIHRVEPEYPEEAKRKHVKGLVNMILTVAEDGSVRDVKISEGNPLLVDAAKQAAMQWRYMPSMNCGKPVEMQSLERVKFPPK